MADTFGTPEASPEETQSKSSSKTVIILIILIILAAIGLAVTIAVQNRNNNPQSTEDVNTVAPVTTTSESTDTNTSPVDTEALKKRRSERVPDITITTKEVEENSKTSSCWTIIDGVVYDVTAFLARSRALDIKEEDICGKDGTKILTEERNGQPPIEEGGPFSPYSRPIGKLAK